MRRLELAVLAAVAAALVSGCVEFEHRGPPTPNHEIGDPCGAASDSCIDERTVQRCVNGVWTALDCDDVCTSSGPAYPTGVCVEETCECALADPNACIPGDTTCEGPSALSTCSDSQTWEITDCDEICQESGLTAVGCVEGFDEASACWCSSEGTPCDPTTSAICADSVTLAKCIRHKWVFEDCETSCAKGGICVGWETPSFCKCP